MWRVRAIPDPDRALDYVLSISHGIVAPTSGNRDYPTEIFKE